MSAAGAPVEPKSTEEERRRLNQLESAVAAEIDRLHKTHALLIATHFAANHDCKFDVSDALAVIRDRVEQSLIALDQAGVAR